MITNDIFLKGSSMTKHSLVRTETTFRHRAMRTTQSMLNNHKKTNNAKRLSS